ncbi:hypothetical protein GCM10010174_00110 [Kutzneria viridogrisea]|uniref:Nucleic acid/nucleotide deaminase of polymorphic system toxin n=1 Tax=Kutzneria viridogrisea TaxID=47990 RepID=A0ABR6BCE2_9PSEU|nr:hypothetical protein [Kutzneria viridogrisea]
MASIEQTVAAVEAAVARLPIKRLREAGALLTQATACLRDTAAGADISDVLGMLAVARQQVDDALALCGQIRSGAEQFAAGLRGDPSGGVPASARTPAPPTSASPPWVPPDRIAAAAAQLPPPVRNPPPRGEPYARTHGRLLDDEGAVESALVSGSDEDSAASRAALAALGLPPAAIQTHVEVKAVMRMRQAGRTHATLVVNNRPCPGPLGCDRLLPVLLEPGQTLTVHWPGGQSRTYSGRRTR